MNHPIPNGTKVIVQLPDSAPQKAVIAHWIPLDGWAKYGGGYYELKTPAGKPMYAGGTWAKFIIGIDTQSTHEVW